MENYAYEKRALVQGDPKKKRKVNTKAICIAVCASVMILSFTISICSKDHTQSKASSVESNEIDFNSKYADYTYDKASIESDFGKINFVNGGKRLFIKEDALCIQYPRLGEGLNNSGAQINAALKGSQEYNLEYEICFDGNGEGFDWQKGGMLSGVAGGRFYDGSGANAYEDGFHALLMYNNYGELYPCIYSVNDATVGGNIYQRVGKATEGKWIKIRQYVKLNDVKESNGIFKVWIDDKLCYSASNIRYRTSNIKVNQCNIQAYSNKSDDGDGAKQEQFVYIDNIKVY